LAPASLRAGEEDRLAIHGAYTRLKLNAAKSRALPGS